MRGVLLCLAAAAFLAGCSDILPTGPQTRLEFACAVLDPDVAERIVVNAWVEKDVPGWLDIEGAHAALERELGTLGARDGRVSFNVQEGPGAPSAGWNASSLRQWADDLPLDFGDEVHLHVLWVQTLRNGLSNLVAGPGVVAVSAEAVTEGAHRLDVAEAGVARAVLLHAAGHALGVVNRGIPVQDPDVQEREGPAGHDPDPGSVLSAGWDNAASMLWAANATYDAYGPALHADWAAAVQPGGVCAQ